jgi:hypothetical protein
MASYSRDPRWIEVRFASSCKECGKGIGRGERAWYYPVGMKMFCAQCGQARAAEFQAAKADEEFEVGGRF